MELRQIKHENGIWTALYEQWTIECTQAAESIEEFAVPTMEHAKRIAAEDGADPRYGLFGLFDGAICIAIMHINCAALPRTIGKTIRCVWILLSPKFDFAETPVSGLANIAADIVDGCIKLARNQPTGQHVKIHLGNAFDREVFATVAALLSRSTHLRSAVRGNWLEISDVHL